jgi:DNA-binding transcriptional LysR family regulator
MSGSWKTTSGALLLNRTTRQFSLTEAGHTYYRTASDILKEIDNLADLVREDRRISRARSDFGTSDIRGRGRGPVAD